MTSSQAPVRITHSAGNDQLLYFTSTSLLAGDRGLVFLSDRTGNPNLFHLDFATGQERPLTRNEEGILKSYVYFDGTPYRGFGKASISLDPDRGIAYYIQGRQVRAVDMSGQERVVAELPAGQMTAFTHVSACGTRLCVPTCDARILDDEARLPARKPEYDVDARVQAEGLNSYLRVFDTATGRELQAEPVHRGWITHVQFSPADRELILYNHEWPADCGIRRMWLWDGRQHRQLRTESPQPNGHARSRKDWTCHEMWERDGSAVIYHGAYHEGPAYIGRVRADGSGVQEIALPQDWRQYGHFTVGRPGQLVTDGYYQTPDTREGGEGQWLALVTADWQGGEAAWQPLARHGSSWTSQDAHPHPIIDHACKAVYFTSDREGRRAVYRSGI
jgi:Tol biopolymer transport system component